MGLDTWYTGWMDMRCGSQIGLTSPTPHLWFMSFNFFGLSLHFLIVIALSLLLLAMESLTFLVHAVQNVSMTGTDLARSVVAITI